MKKRLLFIIAAIAVICAIAFAGCNDLKKTETDDEVSAISFTEGTLAQENLPIEFATLSENYNIEIETKNLESASVSTYNDVTQEEVTAYLALYEGWDIFSFEPKAFYKKDLIVALYYNSESQILKIVSVQLKANTMHAIIDGREVTYFYECRMPLDTEIFRGEELDISDLKITRIGSDDSSLELEEGTGYTLNKAEFDKNIVGSYVFTIRIVGNDEFEKTFTVTVVEPQLSIAFTVEEFEQAYFNGIIGKLTVTLPEDSEGITLWYSIMGENEEWGEWSQTAPELTEVGDMIVRVKACKLGFADTIALSTIRINGLHFENADTFAIEDISCAYDGNAKQPVVGFTVPVDASLAYSIDGGTWSETLPTFTDSGFHNVEFRITKTGYMTFSEYFQVNITKIAVPDANLDIDYYAYFFEGESPVFYKEAVLEDDVLSYSTDEGKTYVNTIPSITESKEIKVKVSRGKNYENIFDVMAIYVPQTQIELNPQRHINSDEEGFTYIYLNYDNQDVQKDCMLVRVKKDDGSWGNWIDCSFNDFPKYNADGVYTYEFKIIKRNQGYDTYTCSLVLPYVPCAGTSWYSVNYEEGEPEIIGEYISLGTDTVQILDTVTGIKSDGTYTATKDTDGNYSIHVTVGENSMDYFYNIVTNKLSNNGNEMTLQESGDVLIKVNIPTMGVTPCVMAVDGKLAQSTIDSFASFGDLYTANEAIEDYLITADTSFTETVEIYCIFSQPDYSEEAFIGYYSFDNQLIGIYGDKLYIGIPLNYTAQETDTEWILTAAVYTIKYNKANDNILLTMEGEEGEFTLARLDQETYAVVTIETDDETLNNYCGIFAVTKNQPYPCIADEYGQLSYKEFENYDGANITEDTTLKLIAAGQAPNRVSTDYIYGDFSRSFTFDIEINTLTIKTEGTPADYSFTVTSIVENTIYLNIEIGEESITASVNTEYPESLNIASGTYQGNYCVGSAYEGAPFIKAFNGESGNCITLNADGTYCGSINEIWIDNNFTAIKTSEGVYSITFSSDEGSDVIGTYDSSANTLTYDGITLSGPAVYYGLYSYQGQKLEINASSVTLDYESLGTVVSASEEVDSIITITLNDEESTTMIYNTVDKTITYNSAVYTLYNPIYSEMSFMGKTYYDNENALTIDEEGNVKLNDFSIGCITNFNEENMSFTLDYYDETPNASLTLGENTVTIGETVYTYTPPEPDPFETAPFVYKPYDNAGDTFRIYPDGEAILNDDVYGTLNSFDAATGAMSFEKLDGTTISGSYSSESDSITVEGVVYTFTQEV